MRRAIQVVALGLGGAGLALAAVTELGGASQYISTCQAVGCFGGSPGCYWYRIGEGDTILCFGRR
jgi:hypothetical protein